MRNVRIRAVCREGAENDWTIVEWSTRRKCAYTVLPRVIISKNVREFNSVFALLPISERLHTKRIFQSLLCTYVRICICSPAAFHALLPNFCPRAAQTMVNRTSFFISDTLAAMCVLFFLPSAKNFSLLFLLSAFRKTYIIVYPLFWKRATEITHALRKDTTLYNTEKKSYNRENYMARSSYNISPRLLRSV